VTAKDLDGDAVVDLVVGSGSDGRVTAYPGNQFAPSGTLSTALDFDTGNEFATGVFVG
jgi:hypothetical protein